MTAPTAPGRGLPETPASRSASGVGPPADHLMRHSGDTGLDPITERDFPAEVHQATGRYMARYSLDPDEALTRLLETAMRCNRPLGEFAHEIAAGHWELADAAAPALGRTADADLVLLEPHLGAVAGHHRVDERPLRSRTA